MKWLLPIGMAVLFWGSILAFAWIYRDKSKVIDMPEEPVDKGDLLQVERVTEDSVFIGFYHPEYK